MSVLIYVAIPVFLLTIAIERAWAKRHRNDPAVKGYTRPDTLASLAMGVGNVIISAGTKVVAVALMVVLYEHRLFTLPTAWWTFVLLFFAEDLCYYAFHRASHEVRFFWAAHINHHSSEHYNLSTALRQSWTTPFTAPLFWLPLPLLGFAPWMVLLQQAISLLYQYWIHTEAIGKLGWFEKVFNTPSHHRVHHGANPRYLDRNHGGILIIWDKLFGTFEPEREKVSYGLTTNLTTYNPVHIAFHEWRAIGHDVRHARSPGDAFMYVFGPPGWSPDGSRKTSRQQRLEAGLA
ncbi:MAG: sterol desaturase family protein [Kofleriaceae bacterium]|nr:MAG: sterol desaturase family protein [Kofleriaceae bacterium]MBZ0234706.1 sterol desaturase family protein [Kofleriaceae bacterium]